jgi:DNA-binding response OmpR family regulator
MKNLSSRRVLVVEDNPSLVANLFAFLEPRDFSLDAAQDGQSALNLASNTHFDALIVDWMLPRLAGPELIKRLRDKGSAVPILMLTARDELSDKLAGFKAGADDYLPKPFAFAELEARLEALILRSRGRHRILQVADLRFDLSTHTVTRGGMPLHLHAGCKRLLEALMRASPCVAAREQLEKALWGEDPPDHDMLRSHIYELRQKVDTPFAQKLIRTVPKVGYRLCAPEAPL